MKKYVVLFVIGVFLSCAASSANNHSPVQLLAPKALHADNHVHGNCPFQSVICQLSSGRTQLANLTLPMSGCQAEGA